MASTERAKQGCFSEHSEPAESKPLLDGKPHADGDAQADEDLWTAYWDAMYSVVEHRKSTYKKIARSYHSYLQSTIPTGKDLPQKYASETSVVNIAPFERFSNPEEGLPSLRSLCAKLTEVRSLRKKLDMNETHNILFKRQLPNVSHHSVMSTSTPVSDNGEESTLIDLEPVHSSSTAKFEDLTPIGPLPKKRVCRDSASPEDVEVNRSLDAPISSSPEHVEYGRERYGQASAGFSNKSENAKPSVKESGKNVQNFTQISASPPKTKPKILRTPPGSYLRVNASKEKSAPRIQVRPKESPVIKANNKHIQKVPASQPAIAKPPGVEAPCVYSGLARTPPLKPPRIASTPCGLVGTPVRVRRSERLSASGTPRFAKVSTPKKTPR